MAKPEMKFKNKGVTVTLWTDRNGRPGMQSVTLDKQYKDKKTNEWKSSGTWYFTDLCYLRNLLSEAIKYMEEQKTQGMNEVNPISLPFGGVSEEEF